jgi:hypothetical protein
MKIELDLPEIEGYEYTGEYRNVKEGEAFSEEGSAVVAMLDDDCQYPILKRKAPKYLVIPCDGNIYGKTLVEIKALKDLIRLAQINIEDMSNEQCNEWDAIKKLIS